MGAKTDRARLCSPATLVHLWRLFTTIAFAGTLTGILTYILTSGRQHYRRVTPQLPNFASADDLPDEPVDITENTTILYPRILSQPDAGYPQYRSLLSAIETWNPDTPEPPMHFTESIQHFDYSNLTQREMAVRFRDAEVPFKVYNVPEFDHVTSLWTDKYLKKHMTSVVPHAEMSSSNHFLYWNVGKRHVGNEYKPPTTLVQLSYAEWLKIAKHADLEKATNASAHFYFMTGSLKGDNGYTFISRDLPIFTTREPNFFITKPDKNKGIQCRFGMRGIIAESHYDAGRNMVAMIKGAKRYILSPPKACKDLGIITDKQHPSYRHSVIDWSDVEQARSRGFDQVDAIETIVRQGEVLYIPSYWFHYIVSLQRSIQCNSRSGSPESGIGKDEIDQCFGFGDGNDQKTSRNGRKRRNVAK